MNVCTLNNIQTAQPKILVLGATGGTGRLIINRAVARGYDVAALVRSPEKGRDLKGATLVIGDARDEQTLRKALVGRDAVISALGTQVRDQSWLNRVPLITAIACVSVEAR